MAVAMALTGCQPRNGEEFVGTWKNIRPYNPDEIFPRGWDLVIERGGGSDFIVTVCRPLDEKNSCVGVRNAERFPAVLVNGMLQIHTPLGPGDISYDPKTKHVLFQGGEDARVESK